MMAQDQDTNTFLMNHSIAELMWGRASFIQSTTYSYGGGVGGIESLGPQGFKLLLSHNSLENDKLPNVVSGVNWMNDPVVILVKVPAFSTVGSLIPKSKSRLSYAITQRPVSDSFFSSFLHSFVSVSTILTIDSTEILQPPCARMSITCLGALTDSRKNP